MRDLYISGDPCPIGRSQAFEASVVNSHLGHTTAQMRSHRIAHNAPRQLGDFSLSVHVAIFATANVTMTASPAL